MTAAGEEPRAPKTRIFIVDDHPIVREGLIFLLDREPDLLVCGEAGSALTTLESLDSLKPDLLIIAISLAEGPDGIELLKSIRQFNATLPVLVFSMMDERLYAERALRAGANGYIMKNEPPERVILAIRQVLANEIYLSEAMRKDIIQQFVANAGVVPQSAMETLTDRELEIFRLIGKGEGVSQIAKELQLSVKTVEAHCAHIKKKLSLGSGRELVQQAILWRVSGGMTPGGGFRS